MTDPNPPEEPSWWSEPTQPGQPSLPAQTGQPPQPAQAGQPSQSPWAAPQAPGQSPWGAPPPAYGRPPATGTPYGAPHPSAANYLPSEWQQQPHQAGGQWETLGAAQVPAEPRRGRGRLVASLIAVIALAGGGVATYTALSDSNSTGASSAEGAVRSLVSDINKSDLIGVLDDLTPGERKALANPFLDAVNQLKRTKVLKGEANPSKVTGLNVDVQNLTFSGKSIELTKSVQVVEVTGGTLDISSDVQSVPFTDAFVKAVFPKGLPASKGTKHVDIAEEIKTEGSPLRIAAQKVGGKWYPSLGYTIAYDAANEQIPAADDAVAAKGASSADEAVRQVVQAALDVNVSRLIELASPDELAPVHTYGGYIVRSVGKVKATGVTVDELRFTDKSIADGTRVFLKLLQFHTKDGHTGSIVVNDNCYDMVFDHDSRHECPNQAAAGIENSLTDFGIVDHVTPAQRTAIEHLVSGLGAFGIDTSKSGGKWYVDPVRSYVDIFNEALSSLQGDDALVLFRMFSQGH